MKVTDMSNIPLNAEGENTHNSSSELLQKIPIQNTPFHAIGNKQDGYRIVFGRHALTEPFNIEPTQDELHNVLEFQKWDIFTTLILSVVDTLNALKKIDEQNQKGE